MTNREWLLNKMQNMSDEELSDLIYVTPVVLDCEYRNFQELCSETCKECQVNWLKSEHKEPITLSEAERTILKNVPEGYQYIARTLRGNIFLFDSKPIKEDRCWVGNKPEMLQVFNHLFQFITWEDNEPYNIQELLEEK